MYENIKERSQLLIDNPDCTEIFLSKWDKTTLNSLEDICKLNGSFSYEVYEKYDLGLLIQCSDYLLIDITITNSLKNALKFFTIEFYHPEYELVRYNSEIASHNWKIQKLNKHIDCSYEEYINTDNKIKTKSESKNPRQIEKSHRRYDNIINNYRKQLKEQTKLLDIVVQNKNDDLSSGKIKVLSFDKRYLYSYGHIYDSEIVSTVFDKCGIRYIEPLLKLGYGYLLTQQLSRFSCEETLEYIIKYDLCVNPSSRYYIFLIDKNDIQNLLLFNKNHGLGSDMCKKLIKEDKIEILEILLNNKLFDKILLKGNISKHVIELLKKHSIETIVEPELCSNSGWANLAMVPRYISDSIKANLAMESSKYSSEDSPWANLAMESSKYDGDDVQIFATNYNVFRILSGMGNLRYT